MGLIKILKRRYLFYYDLTSFRISGQNWERKVGMGSSMIKRAKIVEYSIQSYGDFRK